MGASTVMVWQLKTVLLEREMMVDEREIILVVGLGSWLQLVKAALSFCTPQISLTAPVLLQVDAKT